MDDCIVYVTFSRKRSGLLSKRETHNEARLHDIRSVIQAIVKQELLKAEVHPARSVSQLTLSIHT